MRDAENIQQVVALRPDYMGFILYSKSPRFVGDHFQLPKDFPANVLKVGVFVNETADVILKNVKKMSLDFVQLHGDESVETCHAVKESGVGIFKVFSMDENFDFAKTILYEPVTDYFLFDTKGKYYGGNAKKFDWKILRNYNQKIPFFLSGGISKDDIADLTLLKDMNLHALDVNSGVEMKPGEKDISKIIELQTSLTEINSRI